MVRYRPYGDHRYCQYTLIFANQPSGFKSPISSKPTGCWVAALQRLPCKCCTAGCLLGPSGFSARSPGGPQLLQATGRGRTRSFLSAGIPEQPKVSSEIRSICHCPPHNSFGLGGPARRQGSPTPSPQLQLKRLELPTQTAGRQMATHSTCSPRRDIDQIVENQPPARARQQHRRRN